MANSQMDAVVRHIRRLAVCQTIGDATDQQLLERFRTCNDETAFTTLVERHGPLVLGVCRRLLLHEHDAEDVFQAVFLVLARKAGSIRKQGSLGSWLYGVAYRLASKWKMSAARRRAHEQRMARAPFEEVREAQWAELRPFLDEELHRLPDKYGKPLILCYLEGKSHTEAARALGWPSGSMSRRLTRALALLRTRLEARGMALSTALLAALLGEKTRSALSAELIQKSIRAGVLTAAGQPAVVSPHIANLAQGVLRSMILTKLRIGVALITTASFLALVAGLTARPTGPVKNDQDDGRPGERTKSGVRGEAPADLAVVPPNALGFARIDLHMLLQTDALKLVHEQGGKHLTEHLQQFERSTGLQLNDLNSVVVIVLPPVLDGAPAILGALSWNKPFEQEKVLSGLVPDAKEEEYRGKKLYVGNTAITFPDNHTMVLGHAGDMKGYLDLLADARARGPLTPTLKMADKNKPVFVGFRVSEELARHLKHHAAPQIAFLRPLTDVESGTLVVELNNNLHAQLRLHLPDEKAAQESAEALKTGIGVLKQILAAESAGQEKDPGHAAHATAVAAILRSARVQQESSIVNLEVQADTKLIVAGVVPLIEKIANSSRLTVSQNSLKQMVLAMLNYESTYTHMPPAAIRDKNGKPLLSWRVAILPYIEEDKLYKEFNLDEPWDSEHNKALLPRMPKIYQSPNSKAGQSFSCYYKVFTGKHTAFENPEGAHIPRDFPDGTSNTFLIVEAGDPVPWTKPEDIEYDADKPLPVLTGPYPDGFNAARADGSVIFISKKVSEKTIRALITANGGEVIDQDLKELFKD